MAKFEIEFTIGRKHSSVIVRAESETEAQHKGYEHAQRERNRSIYGGSKIRIRSVTLAEEEA